MKYWHLAHLCSTKYYRRKNSWHLHSFALEICSGQFNLYMVEVTMLRIVQTTSPSFHSPPVIFSLFQLLPDLMTSLLWCISSSGQVWPYQCDDYLGWKIITTNQLIGSLSHSLVRPMTPHPTQLEVDNTATLSREMQQLIMVHMCCLHLISKQVTLACSSSLPTVSHLKRSKAPTFPSLSVTTRLLIACGDVEENPGPGRLVHDLLCCLLFTTLNK